MRWIEREVVDLRSQILTAKRLEWGRVRDNAESNEEKVSFMLIIQYMTQSHEKLITVKEKKVRQERKGLKPTLTWGRCSIPSLFMHSLITVL